MAVLACSKCGREVTNLLIACPNCLTPIGYRDGTPVEAALSQERRVQAPRDESRWQGTTYARQPLASGQRELAGNKRAEKFGPGAIALCAIVTALLFGFCAHHYDQRAQVA